MSSHSYRTASRGSRASHQPPHQLPIYLDHSFCRWCDICPTCGSSPTTAPTATSVPAPVPATSPTPPGTLQAPVVRMNKPILPQLPIQFLFTLFLIEHQLSGDWRHLIIPYAIRSLQLLKLLDADCPLHRGTNHRLPVRQRAQHQVEVEEFRQNLVQGITALEVTESDIDNLANVFTGLVVTESDVDNLANVLTGLVVSDNGPDVRGQHHSKLFSSRDDFQDSVPDVPLVFQPISPSEAISSIQALISTTPMRTAPPTRKERHESTLTNVLERIRTAQKSLDLVYELYATNSDHDSARLALDAATETVVAAGKLLRSVKAAKNDKELEKLWNDVHTEAVVLDKLVDCVGAIVPRADVEVNEVEYNTEHHFEDPIGGHDTVAQIVILFAIISNVVVGLATNPCNFLIDTVTLIIKLTMSLSSPPGVEHSAKQRDILSQLLTTLEDALKTFKLEPKTRILATCPSCHYTHEPQVNRLTAEPSYPTHCENFVFCDKHSPATPCMEPLLKQRQAKLQPIKPFVYPDFIDHLASVLSDPEIAAMCNSACDNAWAAVHATLSMESHGPVSPEEVNNVFEAEFLRTFKGPVPDQLFINRGGRMRLAFQILLDFFLTCTA
ncbi:hypothetical protein C8J57DRAFT_1536854 [Mycena rebaudengoi]|nr:hypothetical protein C8J57DRAFT_1536854 [Mycena rebaudengoi]